MTAPFTPTLEPIMRFGLTLGPRLELGVVPAGISEETPVLSGTVEGPDITGKFVGPGRIRNAIRTDGCIEFDTTLTTELDTGGYLSVSCHGFQFGPADVMAALLTDEDVDPGTYYLRAHLQISTAVAELTYLNRAVLVASGSRSVKTVVLDAFLVT